MTDLNSSLGLKNVEIIEEPYLDEKLEIFTGYTHGIIGFAGLMIIANSFITIMPNILQILIIVIFLECENLRHSFLP